MIDIRHILCPVDFSEHSDHAVAHAVALAGWYEARLTLLHVWPITAPPPPYDELASAALLSLPEQREASLRRLQTLADSVGSPKVTVDAVVEDGPPVTVILDAATKHAADLLVIGTHGRGGFDRLVLGSVTEKILRKAPCPVMTVPHGVAADRLSAIHYKRILCPVDDTRTDHGALPFALSLASESDADLLVLHVVEPHPEPMLTEAGYSVSNVTTTRLAEQWQAELEKAVAPLRSEACRIAPIVVIGKPGVEVLRMAEEKQADLVVMGVRGRGAIDLFVFGSTTNRVVRGATCPVLTVRDRVESTS